jgi:hypothetical protein
MQASDYYYIFCALAFLPVAGIFRFAGLRPWWAALLAVPVIGLILCALMLALHPWPQKEGV